MNVSNNLNILAKYSNELFNFGYCLEAVYNSDRKNYNVILCKVKETKTENKKFPCCGIVSTSFEAVDSWTKRKLETVKNK